MKENSDTMQGPGGWKGELESKLKGKPCVRKHKEAELKVV